MALPRRSTSPVECPPTTGSSKASRAEHAAENAGAGDLRLVEAEIELIDQASPRGPRPRELPLL